MATETTTTINDLPDAILSNICASISHTRTRNSLSLVNRKFHLLERTTRTSITLRGNARYLFMIPTCFRSVTDLDLSLLSPWGHPLLSTSSSSTSDPLLLAHRLRQAFPLVTSLTVYSRSPITLQILLPQWPRLSHVKLVRWHQRPHSPVGADFVPLFKQCESLISLDLSSFYYWTEDLPPVLQTYPMISANLTHLNLLTLSFSEGFKSNEIQEITAACPNLSKFLVACMFDPRYIEFVGDEALSAIASNCPKLSLLHLADTSSLANRRGDPESDGFTAEDARISRDTLIELFTGLPLLQELVLDVCKNVRDSAIALEELKTKCPNLKVLKLGQFHGLSLAIDSQLNGVALCGGIHSLSIKNSADLTDMGLIAIGRGCCRLSKFEVEGCKNITVQGMRTVACLLRRTLVDVKISCCKNLDAAASCRALEPVRDRIQRLHIDCVWSGLEESGSSDSIIYNFDLNEDSDDHRLVLKDTRTKKKCKYTVHDSDNAEYSSTKGNGNEIWCNSWMSLNYLSLWIEVGDLLNPLPMVGLEDCPNLVEIRIKVEGDCRGRCIPREKAFGLDYLIQYPRLSKMQLDCGDTLGYALTAPSGEMDLSLWERYFLNGIENLPLDELQYWPPQDRDVNQRSLSLPAVALLQQCLTLRKLFIHGTAHEHFMMFLPTIPNLRDVQLRYDYYPAPDHDMSTEMRLDSCSRFEEALNRKRVAD
ncbi:hypothetical protein ACOSP7_002204 [Xanthoceras sorbifolium]|uniref:F-box/LRR-repeat protein 15-like leucin rich repeat domain-containing protein n=1 Tax=Xanthoceras sorbifolium TaxID=99658 RepID=A0ABQ8IK45_9ROSI|nr:hypothetical protein JRO89_XS01G0197800 [Xanthoceras sorbifolium]